MPKISEILAVEEQKERPWVAFEYFPPRTADGVANLYKRFKRMASQRACSSRARALAQSSLPQIPP